MAEPRFKSVSLYLSIDTWRAVKDMADEAGSSVPETIDALLEAIVADDRAAHGDQQEAA